MNYSKILFEVFPASEKFVALVENSHVDEGDSLMVRSPSGDIDILLLFLLHQFDGKNVLIDNGDR